ncbi:hypothetical protein HU200_008350 [Digitaria exilis]|uniref:PHD finger protein ALFIN-LIKE n=1 Tax=Digitaria exilis TaxID=1010633 RepID=A0A835FM70_9POAL|nr:hypothetical protein HU200_008350 [Digitaria exilis]
MPVMYLFGNKDGSWEVKPPETYVPHSEPEPAVGINKARDSMKRHKWLQEVARHSDAWLISISFYFGSFLTAEQRKDLFTMINSLPTVQETFLASETKKKSSGPVQENQEEEDVLSGEDKNFCASCGDRYHANAFWIGCNVCERWYHGKCVKIRASEAENIDHYECPECCSEKVGHDYDEDPKLSELFRRY